MTNHASSPVTLHLVVEPPFSLEKTVRSLQRLPTNEIEVWYDGAFYRLLRPPLPTIALDE